MARSATMPIQGYQNDPYTNDAIKYDDMGLITPFTQNPVLKPPYFFCVESRTRDITASPNSATFEVFFSQPLKGVSSIEVIDFVIPNATTAVPNNYFFIANGLYNTTSNTFAAQQPCYGRIYRTPQILATPPAVPVVSNAQNAFGKFAYDTGASSSQIFTRVNARKVNYLTPEENNIQKFQITLLTSTGTLYDLSNGPNFKDWTCTFMIQTR